MAMRQRSLAVDVPVPETVPRRPRRFDREQLGGMAMLLPTVLLLVGLVLYPFVYSIWLSFSDKAVGSAGRFVGLANFRYVIAWPQFSAALVNTVGVHRVRGGDQARPRDGGGAGAQPADPRDGTSSAPSCSCPG